MQFCSLKDGIYFYYQTHPQCSIVSAMANCFILSGAISNCPLLFPSSILDTYCPGGSSCGVISFCLVILSIGFSSQEYWSRLPFPSPVDHILSELFTMTHLSWVAWHGTTHSFIELWKPHQHDKSLILKGDIKKFSMLICLLPHSEVHKNTVLEEKLIFYTPAFYEKKKKKAFSQLFQKRRKFSLTRMAIGIK